jgi:hypothetical protein
MAPWSIWHHRMPYYAKLISGVSAILLIDFIWGFIDATIRRTCRPVYFQQTLDQKYIKGHSLKFQTVVTPDGYIIHCASVRSAIRQDSRRKNL